MPDLSKGVIRYMLTMAVADTMVCVFNVTLGNVFLYHFPRSFLAHTSTCRLGAVIQRSSVQFSVSSTVSFTIDRCIAICCQKLKTKYCTKRIAAVVISTVCVFSFLMHIPAYFQYEPQSVVDGVQWDCSTVIQYYSSPAWQAYRWLSNSFVTYVPLPLLLLLNSLTARHILLASKARKSLKRRGDGEVRDPEMISRRTSIILLFGISGCFIALWAPAMIIGIFFQFTAVFAFDVEKSLYLAIRISVLLMYLSSCANTWIYALTQRRFREELMKLLKYPFMVLVRFF
ncbi:probable G-protein coupled receptor 139 [Narcine bancroftii]|uniref:probable G-protein coupled receptor 139 n=1 Tax=Narcine bancroftii TaxID=1343680 RepID=UPI0038311C02